MTSTPLRPSNEDKFDPRSSIDAARKAAREIAEQDKSLNLDPASELFFEFAAPLLLDTRSEEEFETAAMIAEFIWSVSHFSPHEQALMLAEFIQESGITEEMVPWLLEVYSVLAARKEQLVG